MNRPRAEPSFLTLDAGALIAVDDGNRHVMATLRRAREDSWQILIPAGVLGQVWRSPARQASLAAFLKWRNARIEPLTGNLARQAGVLCGRRGTADVVDASVALCALQHGGRVLTSDPGDLLHLAPSLRVVAVI